MTAPDFLTAMYAAVCTVADGSVDEIDVAHTCTEGDRYETLTVTIRRRVETTEATT